jgi:hypothetical protein
MGEPGNRLPHLCIFPEGVGRVYFTIHFTVRGGGRTPAEVDCDNIRPLPRSTQDFGIWLSLAFLSPNRILKFLYSQERIFPLPCNTRYSPR